MSKKPVVLMILDGYGQMITVSTTQYAKEKLLLWIS